MAIALDGSASKSGSGSSTSISLTTSSTNDVIIVFVYTETANTNPYITVSSVSDNLGLSWASRGQAQADNSNSDGRRRAYYEYYATSATALSADSITVQISASSPCGSCFYVIVFGISGANTGSPFDSNGSLPATATTGAASVSTSNANDLIFDATLRGGGNLDTNFLRIQQPSGNNDSEYQVVSATQSNLGLSWGGGTLSVSLADAVVQASAGTAQPTMQFRK